MLVFPDEGFDDQNYIVFKFYFIRFYDELKKRLQFMFYLSVVSGNEVIILNQLTNNIPTLINKQIILLSLLMARLELGNNSLDQSLDKRNHILSKGMMVMVH